MIRRISFQAGLLGFASSALLLSAAAEAQEAGSQIIATTEDGGAQESGPQAADPTDMVVITGRRLSQANEAIGLDEASATVAVTREALLSAPAGISGLKMLEQLPGFNVQTDGALGLYEFGNSVTVRAFNLQQIGFVLDGIPMGRSDAFGGSPIFRYVDNENLGAVVASPGAGDVSQPSYASLGPIVEYKSIDPDPEFGGTLSYAVGDDSLQRSFIKLQTGQLGPFSAYVSRSKTDSDLWRGGGYIDREHWEAKAVVDVGVDGKLSFRYVSNDFFDYDSPSIGLNGACTVPGSPAGRDCGYLNELPAGLIGTPIDYPGETGVVLGTAAQQTAWYLDRVNIRKDKLFGATYETPVGDDASFSLTAYYEDKDGYGVSPEGYASVRALYLAQQAAGLPVTAPRGVAFGLSGVNGDRAGVAGKFEVELANHTIEAGAWFESDEYHRTQMRVNHEGGIHTGAVLYDEVNYFRRNYESSRETAQFFVKDTISLLEDKLNVEVGVKALTIDYGLNGYRDYNDYYRPGGQPGWGPQSVGRQYRDSFLPMAGAVYKLTPTEQVFASYAQNYALPRATDDVFAIAPNNVAVTPGPEGEESENYEIGFRSLHGEFSTSVALFYTTFDNRLESFTAPLPGQAGATETFYQNVGGVTSYGAELAGAWKPAFLGDYVYFNGNVTWNNTEFDDDIPSTPAPVLIAGNTLPDSPELMVQAGVTFEPFSWLVGNISARYVSERFANFINTVETEDFTIVNAYLDIGEGFGFGPLKETRLRVNVDNVLDEDVIAYIGPSVTGAGSFRPQSPRTLSVSLTAEF